jgi:hypothetical protein
MVEASTVTVEGGHPLVLVLIDHIAFRREAVGVTAGGVVLDAEEAAEEQGGEVAIMGRMMEECTEVMIKATTWTPTMSMILRLPTKIPITKIPVHIQAILRVMENMKVR